MAVMVGRRNGCWANQIGYQLSIQRMDLIGCMRKPRDMDVDRSYSTGEHTKPQPTLFYLTTMRGFDLVSNSTIS